MMQKAQDFDFKPFFDLIVGMLFVLIIMVAAELVFQQYNPANDAQKEQQAAFEKEVLNFLTSVQTTLKNKGFSPTLDVNNRSLTFQSDPFLKIPQHVSLLRDFLSETTQYRFLQLQNIHLHVAVNDLKGQAANDVGEALLTTSMYKEDAALFSLQNAQSHRLILVNKQSILQKEGIFTLKFDINMNKNAGLIK